MSRTAAPTGVASKPRRSSWHARSNAVVIGYLAAAVLAVPVHAAGDASRWLVIHLFVLGAVTNAILIWTRHFTVTLLHVPDGPPWSAGVALAAVNGAVLAVLRGVTADQPMLTVAGAVALAVVVGVHLAALVRALRRALGGRFTRLVWFYCAAAVALLVGIGLGTALAVGVPAGWEPRVYAAHVHVNLLGWVALSVLGTEFTLWPTMLRTRIVDGINAAARRALLLTTAGLTLTVGGLLAANRPVTTVGLLCYIAGTLCALDPFVRTARRKPPRSPATWMMAASTGWLVVTLAVDLAAMLTNPDPAAAAHSLAGLVPVLLVGFVAQVLTGALTYLLPVVLGRGPVDGRRLAGVLDRLGLLRVGLLNGGVTLVALPLPARATLTGWVLILTALAGFVALVAAALVISRSTPLLGGIGIAVSVLLIGLGIAVSGHDSPSSAGRTEPASTGADVRTVPITFANIDITPDTITATPGVRLVLTVTNRDSTRHDLAFPDGPRTRMLNPGESQQLDLGTITGAREGWCTVPGHKAAGMTLAINLG